MIAPRRRRQPQPPIRTRDDEPGRPGGASKKKPQRLQPAGQRSGSGSASVLPYLSLPR